MQRPLRSRGRSTGRLLAAAAALTLLLAACGDSDDTPVATPAADGDADAAPVDADGDMADGDMADDGHDHGDDGHGEGDHGGHGHAEPRDLAAGVPVPTIDAEVVADPAGGWNLRVVTTDFRFAPEHVSTDPVDGEGHAHVYVNGTRISRMYGEWLQLGHLPVGTHEIRVELSHNDHPAMSVAGEVIDDVVTVEVAEATGTPMFAALADTAKDDDGHDHGDEDHDHGDHDHGDGDDGHDHGDATDAGGGDASAADVQVELVYADGSVAGGVETVEVTSGQTVAITVTADIAEELHVHGYDVFADLEPGVPNTLVLTADIPGVFEVELEGRGQLLVELEVR